eukprot:2989316-Amphidinium_carterae.1
MGSQRYHIGEGYELVSTWIVLTTCSTTFTSSAILPKLLEPPNAKAATPSHTIRKHRSDKTRSFYLDSRLWSKSMLRWQFSCSGIGRPLLPAFWLMGRRTNNVSQKTTYVK